MTESRTSILYPLALNAPGITGVYAFHNRQIPEFMIEFIDYIRTILENPTDTSQLLAEKVGQSLELLTQIKSNNSTPQIRGTGKDKIQARATGRGNTEAEQLVLAKILTEFEEYKASERCNISKDKGIPNFGKPVGAPINNNDEHLII